MTAANKAVLSAVMTITLAVAPFPAFADYFSSAGRGGHVFDYFIKSVENSGIKDNKIVTVITSSNSKLSSEAEYIVNCNPYMPHVVDEKDVSKDISIKQEPSSANKFEWELWYAACKKTYAKVSKRAPIQNGLKTLKDVPHVDLDGLAFTIKYRPVNIDAVLANLVSASFERVKGDRKLPILIYCNENNPTVHWNEFGKLVGVDEATGLDLNAGTEEKLVALSKDIWLKTCKQTEGKAVVSAAPSSPKPKDKIAQKQPVKPKADSGELNSVKGIYKNYILAKEICRHHYAGDAELRPVKVKLTKLDKLSKEHSIDVEKLWDDTSKAMEQDAAYQMAQLYRVMPIEMNDRIQMSQSCEQFVSVIDMLIDTHMVQYGGASVGSKKDF